MYSEGVPIVLVTIVEENGFHSLRCTSNTLQLQTNGCYIIYFEWSARP